MNYVRSVLGRKLFMLGNLRYMISEREGNFLIVSGVEIKVICTSFVSFLVGIKCTETKP